MSNPTHNVVVSEKDSTGKTIYTRIGAAWPIDGGGFSVDLKALPKDGKLALFPKKDKDD